MKARERVLAMLLLGGALLLTAATSSQALTMAWMSVDTVLVNKLGGVSLVGRVDCSAAAETIHTDLGLADSDLLILGANNDNYSVSQPAGRKGTIQVSHGSSIMTPCYAEYLLQPDGRPIACEPTGAPCTWQTDEFGYRYYSEMPPLFDYSPQGKFKTGDVAVRAQSIGLVAIVVHCESVCEYDPEMYLFEEGTYAVFNGTVRAVAYR